MKSYNNNQRLRRSLLGMLLTAMILAGTLPSIADVETATRVYDPAGLSQTTVTAPDGNSYMSVDWAGLDLTDTPGKPQLPVEYIRFLVPVYTKVTGVSVKIGSETSSQLSVPVYPGQVPMTTNYTGPEVFTQPDAEAYSQSYPIRAEYVDEGFLDGCNHIVTVAVYPVSYDPKSQAINITNNIDVILEYKECSGAELTSTPLFPPTRSRYLNLDKIVVNPSKVSDLRFAPRREAESSEQEYYYIITPRNLMDAFEDFVVWKKQKGYHVVLKCIEDIYNDSRYSIGSIYTSKDTTYSPEEVLDSAMSLRCYLKDQFDLYGHYFCLLAGDWRTPMPIRKVYRDWCFWGEKSLNYMDNGEFTTPTDNYFIDLTNKWDLIKREDMTIYTSLIPALDFKPSISVGRILCSTSQEVTNYTNKLILYESNPGYGDNTYLNSALGLFEYKDFKSEYNQYIKGILEDFEDPIVLMDKKYEDPSLDGPTGKEVIDQISKVGFSTWHAHGVPAGIACSYGSHYITSTDDIYDVIRAETDMIIDEVGNGLDNLTNINYPAIAYSISCENTPFDYLIFADGHKFDMEYNLGRAFTSGFNTGGVAFIGYTRVGLVGSSAKEEVNFFNELKSERKTGLALINAKYNNYKSRNQKYLNNSLSFIGEPEFEMWLGKPLEFNINLIPDQTGVSIVGELPDDTTCILNDGTDELSKTTVSGSQFTNPFTGEYCFSLWKTDYLPIVTLLGQKGSLNISKRYIVRNALLGNIVSEGNNENCTYSVTGGGNLSVHAIDNIAVYQGFSVENGGVVEFDCDNTVNLNGGIVRKGGTLVIKAKDVKMTSGFKVELGGILKIINN